MISHYKIVEKLGEGGMGVVYKAVDTKLKRTVALKFLPETAIGTVDDMRRFIQEARAAASLDHPNICTIYEIDESDGHTFIAMQLVEGTSLRDRIDKGPLNLERAVEIAIQIAEGLEVAHSKGIIHRDIKSANIMLDERGPAKIMDFGLAKLTDAPIEDAKGSTMGTVAYMSPEQSRGDELDERTDVWSLGVVIYEMIVGLRPFRGTYEQSVIYSICNENPEPVTALRTGVPMELERIIGKALSKSCKQRFKTMSDFVSDLRRLKADMESGEIKVVSGHHRLVEKLRTRLAPAIVFAAIVLVVSGYLLKFIQREAEGAQIPIAVADIVNETDDPGLDGLSGMLITSLEQSRLLSVLTRSSMFDVLKQMGKGDIVQIDEEVGRAICVEANINVLVVASIRKFDELYSIDLKVFDLNSSAHLFAAKEEGTGRASIPGMIDRLAERTRKGLNEKNASIAASNDKLADVTTANLEAYQSYFQGERYVDQIQFDEAKESFKSAIDLDSTFALAQYRLAYVNWWGHETADVQKAQLQRALTLVDRLPEKYRYLLRAQNEVGLGRYEDGIRILKDGEKLYPEDKEILYNIGDFSFHVKEYEDATQYLERVLEMDPTFERALNHLTMTLAATKEFDRALAVGRQYAELTRSPSAYRLLSSIYLASGDTDRALGAVNVGRAANPDDPYIDHQEAMVRCMREEYAAARSLLKSLVDDSEVAQIKYMSNASLVGCDLYMGKYREALDVAGVSIRLAIEAGDSIDAAILYQLRGMIYAWGWGDDKLAAVEFERADEIAGAIEGESNPERLKGYWANKAIYYSMRGAQDAAMEVARARLPKDPESVDRVRFFKHWREKNYTGMREAADAILEDTEKSDKTMVLYFLAEAQLEQGDTDDALKTLEKLQDAPHSSMSRSLFYPPSFLLSGRARELLGDTRGAIDSYERLLSFWNDADADLTILAEARVRVEALTPAATQ